MTLPSFRTTLLSAAALALTACGGDGASLHFSVRDRVSSASAINHTVQAAEATPAPLTFQSGDGVTLQLTQARIHLRDIRLDLPKGTKCADVIGLTTGVTCKGSDSGGTGSGTLVVSGPIVVDLMTGVTTPDLSGLVIPAGTYKRIDFRLEEGHADELPAGETLIGYSLKASADFTGQQAGKKLELALKFSEDARFESATGVEVPEGGKLIAMLQPTKWLTGLPLGTCLAKGDVMVEGDTVRIDDQAKGECGGAEDLVKNNIKTSGDLRKQED